MKQLSRPRTNAFTLVEVSLALGIAAFCLITLLALLPGSVSSNNNSSEETVTMSAAAALVADLKSMPITATVSPIYGIPLTGSILYFNESWEKQPTAVTARYRVTTSGVAGNRISPARTTLQISWPAAVAPAAAAGSVTLFVAVNRQ